MSQCPGKKDLAHLWQDLWLDWVALEGTYDKEAIVNLLLAENVESAIKGITEVTLPPHLSRLHQQYLEGSGK